ncbi:MAG: hypothetical protein H7831_17265, partial [Magnetococcus sp. WYHC-3]
MRAYRFQSSALPVTLVTIAAMVAAVPARAAPLDEFLSAERDYQPLGGEFEVGWDTMNEMVDFLGVRADDQDFSGTTVGDYNGYHLRGALVLTPRLSVDGQIATRAIDYRSDDVNSLTWHGAVQLKLTRQLSNAWPALALRLGRWGDLSEDVVKTTPTTFGGVTANQVRVTGAQDIQTQLDLVASWDLGTLWSGQGRVSLLAGAGQSEVDFDEVFAKVGGAGCEYGLVSQDRNTLSGTLVNDPGGCALADFNYTVGDGSLPGPNFYLAYDASYYQGGLNLQWQRDLWRVRAGYRFIGLDRDIDADVLALGKTVQDTNHVFSGEVGYKFHPRVGVFLRGLIMSNQYAGDLPLAYNAFTAHRFD